MEEIKITASQKYENYKEQFTRLNKALTNGFNLEAIFIEYAIMEDRTESILRHAGMWESYLKNRGDSREPSIESKIKYIQKRAFSNKKDLLNKYFSDTDSLLRDVLLWKDNRNKLIHALLKQQLNHDEIANLALEGSNLAKQLRTRVGNYNRAIERNNH